MLGVAEAERIVAEELEARGHRVLRVDICESIHDSQRPWPAVVVYCLGEMKRYDCESIETILDEHDLRAWVRDHWLAVETK